MLQQRDAPKSIESSGRNEWALCFRCSKRAIGTLMGARSEWLQMQGCFRDHKGTTANKEQPCEFKSNLYRTVKLKR